MCSNRNACTQIVVSEDLLFRQRFKIVQETGHFANSEVTPGGMRDVGTVLRLTMSVFLKRCSFCSNIAQSDAVACLAGDEANHGSADSGGNDIAGEALREAFVSIEDAYGKIGALVILGNVAKIRASLRLVLANCMAGNTRGTGVKICSPSLALPFALTTSARALSGPIVPIFGLLSRRWWDSAEPSHRSSALDRTCFGHR